MSDNQPTFPPLLRGHNIAAEESVLAYACGRAQEGALGAGDLVWSATNRQLSFAVVLEPEVHRDLCSQMIYVAMVAFGDAAGALIPPEVAVTYQWPNIIQMNDGQIGDVDLLVSSGENDGVPSWMVLSVQIQLSPDLAEANPGENYHHTTLWDEGCGEITWTEMLESMSRHLVNVIHTWSEDGFRPVHEQWLGRLSKADPLARDLDVGDSKFVGVDETGNALLALDGRTNSHPLIETLTELRRQPAGIP